VEIISLNLVTEAMRGNHTNVSGTEKRKGRGSHRQSRVTGKETESQPEQMNTLHYTCFGWKMLFESKPPSTVQLLDPWARSVTQL
jgi:hypothetical protein